MENIFPSKEKYKSFFLCIFVLIINRTCCILLILWNYCAVEWCIVASSGNTYHKRVLASFKLQCKSDCIIMVSIDDPCLRLFHYPSVTMIPLDSKGKTHADRTLHIWAGTRSNKVQQNHLRGGAFASFGQTESLVGCFLYILITRSHVVDFCLTF